jgi:hypothetical protein
MRPYLSCLCRNSNLKKLSAPAYLRRSRWRPADRGAIIDFYRNFSVAGAFRRDAPGDFPID